MALEFSIPAILVVWQATVVRSSLEGHNQPER
jgi:hypothetical protein